MERIRHFHEIRLCIHQRDVRGNSSDNFVDVLHAIHVGISDAHSDVCRRLVDFQQVGSFLYSTERPTDALLSSSVNIGAIVGGTLGGLALFASIAFGFFYLRKRKATRPDVSSSESAFQVNPFTSEFSSPTPPSAQPRPFFAQHHEPSPSVPPLTRTAILRDALAVGNYPSGPDPSSHSVRSGQSSAVFQPLRRQPSNSVDADLPVTSSASDASSPFSDPSRYNLTADQVEVVDRLRVDNVPVETIARVIEGYVASNLSGGETSGRKVARGARSIVSAAPPPSYQTREG